MELHQMCSVETSTVTSLKKSIVLKIKQIGGVSFVDLKKYFPAHFDGDHILYIDKGNKNVIDVLWSHVSKEFLVAMLSLIMTHAIMHVKCPKVFYDIEDPFSFCYPEKIDNKITKWSPVMFFIDDLTNIENVENIKNVKNIENFGNIENVKNVKKRRRSAKGDTLERERMKKKVKVENNV